MTMARGFGLMGGLGDRGTDEREKSSMSRDSGNLRVIP